MALNRVDFPTFGNPIIPAVQLILSSSFYNVTLVFIPIGIPTI